MKEASRFQKEFLRFFKFLLVGTIGAIIDFGIMNLVTILFSPPLVVSGSISFICAVLSNFLWNRFWIYPDSRSRPVTKQLVMFFIVNTVGIMVRIPVLHFVEPNMYLILSKFGEFPISLDVISKNLTLAITVILILFWNFFINRLWTYNDLDKVENDSKKNNSHLYI